MGKVIDLTTRLKTLAATPSKVKSANIVDYDEQKQKILFHERRQIKRTILTEFVSAMLVIPDKGLLKVAIYDISEQGVSFDVEFDQGSFKVDEEVSMRIYLNQKTYFPITLQVKHMTEESTEGVNRHGAVFLRQASADAALQYFVKFIEAVSQSLKKDSGDLMVPKIS
jgi:hypothetical protein